MDGWKDAVLFYVVDDDHRSLRCKSPGQEQQRLNFILTTKILSTAALTL